MQNINIYVRGRGTYYSFADLRRERIIKEAHNLGVSEDCDLSCLAREQQFPFEDFYAFPFEFRIGASQAGITVSDIPQGLIALAQKAKEATEKIAEEDLRVAQKRGELKKPLGVLLVQMHKKGYNCIDLCLDYKIIR